MFTMSPTKWIESTEVIKDNLIPSELTLEQIAYTYANEVDMLNVVLFGIIFSAKYKNRIKWMWHLK